MANKKSFELSEKSKAVLRDFLNCQVPRAYYDLDARGNTRYDFNYCYEEVYDYADALLRGQEISLNRNFVGAASVSVNDDFKGVLEVLGRRNLTLEDFCVKFADAIQVIMRAAR